MSAKSMGLETTLLAWGVPSTRAMRMGLPRRLRPVRSPSGTYRFRAFPRALAVGAAEVGGSVGALRCQIAEGPQRCPAPIDRSVEGGADEHAPQPEVRPEGTTGDGRLRSLAVGDTADGATRVRDVVEPGLDPPAGFRVTPGLRAASLAL